LSGHVGTPIQSRLHDLLGVTARIVRQLGSIELAPRDERQLIREGDAFRDLEVGEPSRGPTTSHDHGDPLAVACVGNAEHHRLNHTGMGREDILDAFGGKPLSPALADIRRVPKSAGSRSQHPHHHNQVGNSFGQVPTATMEHPHHPATKPLLPMVQPLIIPEISKPCRGWVIRLKWVPPSRARCYLSSSKGAVIELRRRVAHRRQTLQRGGHYLLQFQAVAAGGGL
jgi:hypothetical protein